MIIQAYTLSQNRPKKPNELWCEVMVKPFLEKALSSAEPSPAPNRDVTPPTACTSARRESFLMWSASALREDVPILCRFTANAMSGPSGGTCGKFSFQKCISSTFAPAGISPPDTRIVREVCVTLTRNRHSGSSQYS